MSSDSESDAVGGKRLIVCCDGTWDDSDDGYQKAGLFSSRGTLVVPTNVTRISRCFKHHCADGRLQVIFYQSGVGTGSNFLDAFSGGAFGVGVTERVREAYSFICNNYSDGDEIVLTGFSRGAFTARTIAGVISDLGLLTREGLYQFYPIFKDMENWETRNYHDPFPNDPFPNKPMGPGAADEYRARLQKMGYTRVNQHNGDLIKIKAVGANADRLRTFRWHDTALSNRIEYAFQALALDETRPPFTATLWEKPAQDHLKTDLRQVWFPGNHGNIGGGWADQGIASCTLAWMADQMASIGIEFDNNAMDRVFQESIEYYTTLKEKAKGFRSPWSRVLPWAVNPIYENNTPTRPWGLESIQKCSEFYWLLAGQTPRTPGLNKEVDPKTGRQTNRFLQNTNERIHSSVRVRLTCRGLGLNDKSVWTAPSLSKWQLKLAKEDAETHLNGNGHTQGASESDKTSSSRWAWEYAGDEKSAPTDINQRTMVEEALGPYEQRFIRMAGGRPNVFDFAATDKTGLKKAEERR